MGERKVSHKGSFVGQPQKVVECLEKLSEKGPEATVDPLFLAPKAAKQGYCEPFLALCSLLYSTHCQTVIFGTGENLKHL
jgi:hypothetical protein